MSVLLLKAEDARYREIFRERGYDAHFAEVLSFRYVQAEVLRAKLQRLESVGAILVTSPRAGIAVQQALASMGPAERDRVVARLRETTVFSVGKATSRELEGLGVRCLGDDCGSAEVLAEYLHHEGVLPVACTTLPTLFLCGEKRRDTLPESFHQRGLPLEELMVYETCAVENFAPPVACPDPDWVVYFSPSGIRATRTLAREWTTRVKKAAIGKTTAAALLQVAEETSEATWAPTVTAAQPTAEGLVQAIAEYEEQHMT